MVVVDLDAEDSGRAGGGDEVGGYQRPVDGVAHETLSHEESTSETHEQEGRHGDAVGVAGADGIDGLWQIAQYHAYGGYVAEYVE